MDREKAVQGVAVYAEFRRSGATTQVIVTPDGFTSEDVRTDATLIRRTITENTPKKQWRFAKLARTELSVVSDSDKSPFADSRMRYAASLFDQLLAGGWQITKQPILIEMSKKDCDDICRAKTPTKMLYRISQSRIALDFPAELIDTKD